MFECYVAGSELLPGKFLLARQVTFPRTRDVWSIVNKHLKLVYNEARRCCSNQQDFNDLVQEGTVGLYYAVVNRNTFSRYKFSTYAVWWIRKYILAFYQTRGVVPDPLNELKHEPHVYSVPFLDTDAVRQSLFCLDDFERLVISLRYLAETPSTLQQIARTINTTASFVQQVEVIALKKMRVFLEE